MNVGLMYSPFSLLRIIILFIAISLRAATHAKHEQDSGPISIDDLYDREVGLDPATPPELLDFNRYRLNENWQRYFRVGETDSCNENMRFFADPNNAKLGQCDCDWFQCSRPLLYCPVTGKCYLAWSRGPCGKEEWYTFGDGMVPTCKSRPCPESPLAEGAANFYFQNPKDGKCYEAGTRGYCENENERLGIYPNQPIPECRNATICYPLAIPAPQLCIQGNRFHHQSLASECAFSS